MRKNHSIAGKTIFQTTLEDADTCNTQFLLEKVRRSPKSFVRKGNKRETGAEVGSRETSSKTNWLEGPH